jgi:hypothetical protein
MITSRFSTPAIGSGSYLPGAQPIGRFASPLRPRFNRRMPELTRKRVNNRPMTWHVHYAGVRVGVVVERSGAPPSSDQWQWCCGFYPGSQPCTVSRPGDSRNAAGASLLRKLSGAPATAETGFLSATGGKDACCGASAIALDLKSRLDAGWSGDQIMKSTSPPWMWVALALLALTFIGYVAMPAMRSTTGMLAASSSAR